MKSKAWTEKVMQGVFFIAAVFGDFADELGDGKGTPGAERYFCFRARFRSAKNAAVLSSVIPQALSPH